MKPRTYTTAQAAKKVGVSRQSLHFWVSNGLVKAPEPVKVGRLTYRFWTGTDIKMLREFKGTLRPGPKKARKS